MTEQTSCNDLLKEVSLGRIARVRASLLQDQLRALYIRDTSNIAWVSAFEGVFDSEQAHALLVTPYRVLLHTDSRYSAAARKAACDTPITIDDQRVSHASWIADVFTNLHGDEPRASTITLGIEDEMSLGEFRSLERTLSQASVAPTLQETHNYIRMLRAVKDSDEIARMRFAQSITDAAFAYIITYMKPGMTEREVQIELDTYMRTHGAEDLAFASIVATGAQGANPHATPGETRLEAGQCVVMDFGARAQGYCSDMTRMVFLGEPSARLRDAYAALRAANEEVEALLRPGITGAYAHETAERILAEHGFAGKMGHGLGHGVGIDIHEEPVLSPRNTRALEPGNVVTVEPGIYFEGEFGMRLEDFGVITEDGFDVFTQSTHEMVIL